MKVNQVNNLDSGAVARNAWNQAMKTVETDSSISGDGTVGNPLSTAIVGLDNRIVVKSVADFVAPLDSTKEYFLDGIIDMGTTSLEIPAGGLYIRGFDFNISGLISSDPAFSLFTSPVGGSGDLIINDLQIDISGAGSQVWNIFSDTGFKAIEITAVNFNNCTSLGTIDNYRQGLENGTGYFGGQPELTLAGVWVGGWLRQTCIVRGLIDGAYSLFKAGAGFSMSSRFKTDLNADLNTTVALSDFAPANFPNPSTVQIQQAILSRNGVIDATDLTIMPNMLPSDLPAQWIANQGLQGTYVGGLMTLTTEVLTPIITQGVPETLLGTWTASDLQHFDNPVQNQIRNLGTNPIDYRVRWDFVLDGQQNTQYRIDLVKDDGAPTVVASQTRYVVASPGGNDLGFFTGEVTLLLNQNDFLYWEIANLDGTQDCTLLLESIFEVFER